jgi:hypothetical protein
VNTANAIYVRKFTLIGLLLGSLCSPSPFCHSSTIGYDRCRFLVLVDGRLLDLPLRLAILTGSDDPDSSMVFGDVSVYPLYTCTL